VARILRTVEARWIEEGFPGDARIGELLDRELAQKLT
jgi:poly(A) polymerase